MSKCIVALAAGLAMLVGTVTGCVPVYRDSVVQKTQTIQVTSEPPGALVSVRDENGSRTLGNTPIEFEESFQLVDREYDKGSCVLSGGAAGADIVGGDGIHSEAEAAGTLIGMVLGAAIGAASCAEAEGIVSIQPKKVVVHVSLPGFYPQEVAVQIPKDRENMHFELVPKPAVPPEPGPADTSARPPVIRPARTQLPVRLAVFTIQATPDRLEPAVLEALSVYLANRIRDTEAMQVVDPQQIRSRLADGSEKASGCADLDCRLRVSKDCSADQLLDTRIMVKDGTCLVSASLFDSSTRYQQLVAASSSACEQEALESTMDKISELLINPPQAEKIAPPKESLSQE